MVRKYDYLVIGSGIAGMSFALKVAETGRVALICKSDIEEANTFYAQGGVASVTNLKVDNFDKHIEDTMIAGDWLSDRAAVEKVVKGAPEQINQLLKWGVDFDRKEDGADTRSSASCTTPTTPAPKSSRVSCAPSKVTPTSTCLRISSPLKS
mgnify:CR=1 FL=1